MLIGLQLFYRISGSQLKSAIHQIPKHLGSLYLSDLDDLFNSHLLIYRTCL